MDRFNGNGILITAQLLPKDNYEPSYQEDFMHLALAASCYFADACAHANCIQKHATLVWICGSYLWPASLPKEPMVRRGLEGLTQVGSGVFCTSVLTSGSISEGEGVSLAPAMALCLPECYLQQRAANSLCFPPPGVRTGRLTQRPTPPDKTASRLNGAAQRRRGSVCLPAASRGPQTH